MKTDNMRHITVFLLIIIIVLSGCGSNEDKSGNSDAIDDGDYEVVELNDMQVYDPKNAVEIPGLVYEATMKLDVAECFSVYYYSEGYKLLNVPISGKYLMVPEGKEVPAGLGDDFIIINAPLKHVYLTATSTMSLFLAIDATNVIEMTGTAASGWQIEEAKKLCEDGTFIYAGKYSEPDYELLIAHNCDLAIESTMILHTPEVQEMLEDIGIPVFIDRSSYEASAIGRTEWIKLYGAMTGKEQEAFDFYNDQAQILSKMEEFESTGKTVAYFSISSTGTINIRRPGDYIANMINDGGGVYIFDGDVFSGSGTTVNISFEEFYSKASNCDYLIYNGAIETSLKSIDDLIDKDPLFAEFKAVKEGNVWQVGKGLYQATDKVAQLINDVHIMLTDGDMDDLVFLVKVPE